MKNKKFLKAIATITIGAVASVGCFSIAACSSCDDEHTHSYTLYEQGEGGHYEKCECGDVKSELLDHVYDNDQDVDCNACGAVRTIGGTEDPGDTHDHVWSETYVNDQKAGHHQTCTVEGCTEVKSEGHQYDNDEDTTCNANGCGYVRDLTSTDPDPEHTQHTWGTTYISDGADGHHQKCTYEGCNAVSETVAHVYDNDEDATCNSTGCGYEREVGGDTPVTPVKTIYETLAEREDNIIAENFATTTTADLKVHNGTYGAAGVYVRRENGSELVSGEYKVDGGALVLGTGNKVTDGNVLAVVDFGIVSGTVEGYFEFKMSADSTGNYNNVNFVNQGNTVLKIMASGSSFVYTLNGAAATAENAVTAAKNTTYKVEFKFDLTNKKLTLKINGTAVFTDVDSDIDAITGLTVNTSNGGQRNNTVDNIAVCGTPVALADYQADLAGKLDAKAAEMTGEGGTHTTENAKGKVEAALTAGKGAVNAAENHVDALTAYNNAVKAMNLIAGDAHEHVYAYIYELYPEANYTNPAAKAIYEAQLAIILAETDAEKLALPDAETETPAGATLAAVLTELAKMDNDATAYEKYIAKVGEDIGTKEFPYKNYLLNDKYMELFEGADVKQHLGEGDTYADAVAEFDAVVADLRVELAKLDTDAKIIEARANELLKGLDDEIDRLLTNAGIEDPSEDLKAAIAGEKPTVAALTANVIDAEGAYAVKSTVGEGENAQEVYAYEISMWAKIEAAQTKIQKIISESGATLEEAIAQAETDYAAHVAEMLDGVKDPALKATLAADTTAPKFSEIVFVTDEESENRDTATTVGLKRKAQEDKYDGWLAGKLAAKTYKVTVNGVGDKAVEVTVKYGDTATVSTPANTEDKKFIGWYSKEEYTDENKVDLTKLEIYSDTAIYAGWEYADIIVNYYVGNNLWKTVKAFSTDEVSLELPTVAGGMKTLTHWYIDDEDTPYAIPEDGLAAGTLNLHAKGEWKTDAELTAALEGKDWVAAADSTVTNGVITNHDLYTLSTLHTSGAFTGGLTATDKMNDKTFTCGYHYAVAKGATSDEQAVVITAKEDIKVTLYVGLAGSNAKDTRQGTLLYSVNGIEKTIATAKERSKIHVYQVVDLKAGDVLKFYMSVPSDASYDAHMWLFGVDAQLNVTNATVVFHDADGNVHESVGWCSVNDVNDCKPSTIPEKDAQSTFVGWSINSNATEADATFTFEGTENNTLHLYPVYKGADIKVTYAIYGEEGVEKYYTDGDAVALLVPEAREGYKFVGWFTDNEYKNKYTVAADATWGEDDKNSTLYGYYAEEITKTLDVNSLELTTLTVNADLGEDFKLPPSVKNTSLDSFELAGETVKSFAFTGGISTNDNNVSRAIVFDAKVAGDYEITVTYMSDGGARKVRVGCVTYTDNGTKSSATETKDSSNSVSSGSTGTQSVTYSITTPQQLAIGLSGKGEIAKIVVKYYAGPPTAPAE